MHTRPRRVLRILGAMTLPLVIALAACQPAGGGASASPSDAMMEHSASPSDAMMEHSESPSPS